MNETSWEDWEQLQQDFHLEDKVRLQGPKSVMNKEASGGDSMDITATTEGILTNKEVQKETTFKRRIKKPTYLKDFV